MSQPAAAQAPQLAYGLSSADVSNGFIASVLEACVTAAERGVRLDQLSNYRILHDTVRSTSRPPKPGYAAWAPGLGQGIVEIEDGPGGCDVSAHGAPITGTFEIIVMSLRARGYALEPEGEPHKRELHTKLANGRSVTVVLTGVEAGSGSPTPFSQLAASITSIAP
ncbi:MAG: hypothetical protein EOP61_21490 [Sphingomonadales bacterium]|nr:MAG: hypothetical protein EOP61_21490 [Sphingomonadales bacterium]